MIEMRGHVLPDHPLARYFKGHVPFERTALFRAFRAPVGTHIKLPICTLLGDYKIKVMWVRLPATLDEQVLLGNSSTGDRAFDIRDSDAASVPDRFAYSAGGQFNAINDAFAEVENGSLFSAILEKSGSTVSLTVNGVAKGSFENANPVAFDLIANSSLSSRYAEGSPYLVEVQDFLNPAQSFRYRDFTHPDGIVPNELGALGAELTTGAIRKAGGCALDGNTITNTNGGWGYLYEDIPVDIGQPYMIVAAADFSGDGDGWRLHVWENDNYVFTDLAKVDGLTDQVIALVTSSIPVIRVGIEYRGPVAGGQITKNLLSVREAPGYARLQNDADGSIFRYTKKGQAWVGPELWQEDSLENFGASSRIASISFDGNSNTLTSAAASGEFWVRKASHSDLGGAVVECEAKAGASDYILLRVTEDKFAVFDLVSGSVLTTDGVDASISVGAGGWAKCKVRSEGSVSYPAVGMSDGSLQLTPTLPAGRTVEVRNPRLYPLIPIALGAES